MESFKGKKLTFLKAILIFPPKLHLQIHMCYFQHIETKIHFLDKNLTFADKIKNLTTKIFDQNSSNVKNIESCPSVMLLICL